MQRLFMCSLAALLAGSAACAPAGDGEDLSLASEDGDDDLAAGGKADGLDSTSTYYSVRPDLRECLAPLCGGWWVKRPNRSSIQCADGGYRAECYVATI